MADLGPSNEERTYRRSILDKTTGKQLQKDWEQQDRLDIEMHEKALAPPVITEKKCHVCTSEWRAHIERQLVKGYAYQAIANELPPDKGGRRIDRRSIARHFKEHMPIDQAAIRAQLEDEADILRQNYEQGHKGALTNKGIVKVLIRKAYEDALNGITTVEPRDLIQMVKLLGELEEETSLTKAAESEVALRVFTRAIQNVCNQDQLRAIVDETRRLRQMDDIEFEMEGILIPQIKELPEAQIVEIVNE